MKTRTTLITVLMSVLLLVLALSKPVQACDWCNNKFFMELNTTRKSSLASQELLNAIHSQHDFSRMAQTASVMFPQDAPVAGSPAAVQSGNTGRALAPGSTPSTLVQQIVRRDAALSLPPTGYVLPGTPIDKHLRIELAEGDVYLGNGVMYHGFTVNGTIPGPTLIVDEGDVVEFKVVNRGTIPHGASIHAAYTQTSKYVGKIAPGDSASVVFKATIPGTYLYHCAPGGHAIPMHIIFGQYGTIIVRPKAKFRLEQELGRKPDVEITLSQHEFYANGRDAVTGQGEPMYTVFNGKLFRYVEEPIKARPGDYVRINYINIGPNLVSTFHIVGIVWDYAYWQGNPKNIYYGGQSVVSGPTDSWVIEFRMPPDAGAYTMLSHAVGSTDRGAIGLIIVDEDHERDAVIDARGPVYTPEQLAEFREKSVRTISPFQPGTPDVDVPVVYGPETDEVIIRIIGNSFYPKVVDVQPGTKITWINEDVFTYLTGEFSGIHNVVGISGPASFASPLLTHAETFSKVFTEVGEYNYICAPHPYMKAIVRVSEATSPRRVASAGGSGSNSFSIIALVLAAFAAFASFIAITGLKQK
jgi:nitrite reductase (NO-forming)